MKTNKINGAKIFSSKDRDELFPPTVEISALTLDESEAVGVQPNITTAAERKLLSGINGVAA